MKQNLLNHVEETFEIQLDLIISLTYTQGQDIISTSKLQCRQHSLKTSPWPQTRTIINFGTTDRKSMLDTTPPVLHEGDSTPSGGGMKTIYRRLNQRTQI